MNAVQKKVFGKEIALARDLIVQEDLDEAFSLGSCLGFVPTGNTGGTDISMFKRLPIDPDLLIVMADR